MSDRKECSHFKSCAMFDLFSHEGTLAVWKINYCDSSFSDCERYRMTERGEQPPDEMLPNGKSLPMLG